jgi:hypothetical protein
VLRWLTRLASVLATAVLAYGWGDFATDPGPLEVLVLIVLTVVLFAALHRLYRAGGVAAFDWDDEHGRHSPGPPTRASKRVRRAPGEPAPAPEPTPAPAPRAPRGGSRPSGSLWSSERDPEE